MVRTHYFLPQWWKARFRDQSVRPQWLIRRILFHHLLNNRSALVQSIRALSKSKCPDQRHHLIERAQNDLVGRSEIFRNLAEAELRIGRDLVAALYQIRVIRWLGEDHFRELEAACEVLQRHGLHEEAKMAQMLYSNPPNGAIYDHLRRRQESLLKTEHFDFCQMDDRRANSRYKVAVIVSLYRAASKLPHFLNEISRQTLTRSNQLEIVLIDSGSPDREYEAFKQVMSQNSCSVVYARSRERESIMAAWNRGISLARADYLSFLGVDEGLTADALEKLAAELDKNARLDLVGSNADLFYVDSLGRPLSKLTQYNRSELSDSSKYLDPIYINFVGFLHRKSLHERFGYFDPNLRASGDTEFKNRVMPFIETKVLKEKLGFYWNYAEARATENPLSEAEDLLALYPFRTLDGVRYTFENKTDDEIWRTIFYGMGFRLTDGCEKIFDLEYVLLLLKYQAQRAKDNKATEMMTRISSIQSRLQKIDSGKSFSSLRLQREIWQLQDRLAELYGKVRPPALFSENRYVRRAGCWL